MTARWLREEQPDHAALKILDAAEKAFVELGVSGAGMAQIAETAGCSRGTLYRYFPTRHALHVAYVKRATVSIFERVREATSDIVDPQARVVEYVLRSVQEVRGNPGTAAWFTPGAAAIGARMSRSSEVVELVADAFAVGLPEPRRADSGAALRAQWLVRVIVSLLADPAESEAVERALVARFVAPALTLDARTR